MRYIFRYVSFDFSCRYINQEQRGGICTLFSTPGEIKAGAPFHLFVMRMARGKGGGRATQDLGMFGKIKTIGDYCCSFE